MATVVDRTWRPAGACAEALRVTCRARMFDDELVITEQGRSTRTQLL